MALFTCEESRPGYLTFSGELTVDDAPELKDLLWARLQACPSLDVDMLNVTKLDTAGLQLMVAVQRAALDCGKTVSWMGFSSPVEEVIAVLNLGETLTGPAAVIWS